MALSLMYAYVKAKNYTYAYVFMYMIYQPNHIGSNGTSTRGV